MSTPSLRSSERSGEQCASVGYTFAGRTLTARSKALRSPSSEFFSQSFHLGLCCSWTGPPTEPKRMASERSHSAFVTAGKCSPCASNPAPPMLPCSNVIAHFGKSSAVLFNTLSASFITSGPMPSPGSTATLRAAFELRERRSMVDTGSPKCDKRWATKTRANLDEEIVHCSHFTFIRLHGNEVKVPPC